MKTQNSNADIDDQPKIRVVIRKRPLNKKQQLKGEHDVVQVTNGVDVKVREQRLKVDLTKYTEEHLFKFDSAFGDQIDNKQLYQQCVRPIVHSAFLGARVTCFAYGQTGSGKTYTMNGDLENNCPGMYYLAAQDIFNIRNKQYRHLTIFVSFFQIYCGKLHDLLNNREQLEVLEDGKKNLNIIGLEIKPISCTNQFLETIAHGSSVRITSQNSTNSESSRSHAVLQISLMNEKKLHGKISFIDLAGCQRGADTLDQNKQTKKDGAQINRSLLALKECIRALDLGKNHTPFRGSKLTMVLKDSFTGFCRTLMIGNVSPGSGSCENTLNTLRYADRVKQLKKGGVEMTKQQRETRQLGLTRNSKNTQIIIKNKDDSDEQIIIQSSNMYAKGVIQQKKNTQTKKLKNMKQQAQSLNQVFKKKVNVPEISKNGPNDKNKNQRKGVMNISHNTHQNQNENYNPKSVAHAQFFQKSVENSRIKVERNKSVFNKIEGGQVQKGGFTQLRKNIKQPVTQRGSFYQNHSVLNLNQKYKQLIGESQKIKANTLQNNSQINLTNRYGKKNKETATYKIKTDASEQNHQVLECFDNKEWEQILKRFRNWKPNRSEFEQMSVLFEELVKLIMREELQITEYHKKLLISEEKMLKQSLGLYNQVQRQSKNNQEMMDYTERLNRHLEDRVKCFQQLRQRIDLYQYHLKEHENCENKLIQASEENAWNSSHAGTLQTSDVALWNQ